MSLERKRRTIDEVRRRSGTASPAAARPAAATNRRPIRRKERNRLAAFSWRVSSGGSFAAAGLSLGIRPLPSRPLRLLQSTYGFNLEAVAILAGQIGVGCGLVGYLERLAIEFELLLGEVSGDIAQ